MTRVHNGTVAEEELPLTSARQGAVRKGKGKGEGGGDGEGAAVREGELPPLTTRAQPKGSGSVGGTLLGSKGEEEGGAPDLQVELWLAEVEAHRRRIEAEVQKVLAAEVEAVLAELRMAYPHRRKPVLAATGTFVRLLLATGLTRAEICKVFGRNQTLFARSGEGVLEMWAMLAMHGVTAEGLRRMLRVSTHWYWLSTPVPHAAQTVEYFEEEFGAGSAVKIVTSSPDLMGCRRANLEGKVEGLRDAGVGDVEGMVRKFPSLLSNSADEIRKKVASLKDVVGDGALAVAALEKHPALLRASVATPRRSVRWLEETFGSDVARRMIATQPTIMGTRVETSGATYAELVALFEERRALRMVTTSPNLLGCGWAVLHPKVQYFRDVLGRSLDEIAAAPSVLGHSLERRIKPRFEALAAAGRSYTSLAGVLNASNSVFEAKYDVLLPPATRSEYGQA